MDIEFLTLKTELKSREKSNHINTSDSIELKLKKELKEINENILFVKSKRESIKQEKTQTIDAIISDEDETKSSSEGVKNDVTDNEDDIEELVDNSIKKKILYSFLLEEQKVLDYSTLDYGKIAEPLAISWTYSDYENKEQKGESYSSKGTFTIKDVDKIIEEKMMNDMLHTGISTVSAETQEAFKYFKLFNAALIKIKYSLART